MDEIVKEKYMKLAIKEAKFAGEKDEVPIGAIIVQGDKIIGKGHNLRNSTKIATHHAEILAIERACEALGGWRLPGVTLYVTMEPCAMCAGAIINSRIERVVYGARDFRFGAFGSALDLNAVGLNHKVEVVGGVLGDECADILSSYFKRKRKS